MTRDISLPPPVIKALARLEAAGFAAYVVGGCVRDAFLGRETDDWDIATAAAPTQTKEVFADAPCIDTGLRHGTVTVLLDGLPLQITTFRADGSYSDARHPDTVRFSDSIFEDLARRDFTVNAMAYAPGRGLADPHGGTADIAAAYLRCVGNPWLRFGEDALRIMRALRFSAVLDFSIEPQTASALRARRGLLPRISAERRAEELRKLLRAPRPGAVLTRYASVIAACVPALAAACGDKAAWQRTAEWIDALPPEFFVRLAALFSPLPLSAAQEAMAALRLDNAARQAVGQLLEHLNTPPPPDKPALLRMLRQVGPEGLSLWITWQEARAGVPGTGKAEKPPQTERIEALSHLRRRLDAVLTSGDCYTQAQLALRGRDLEALGLRGGEIGRALRALLEAVIDGDCPNEPRALLERLKGMPSFKIE